MIFWGITIVILAITTCIVYFYLEDKRHIEAKLKHYIEYQNYLVRKITASRDIIAIRDSQIAELESRLAAGSKSKINSKRSKK
jgi:hypothetical protein